MCDLDAHTRLTVDADICSCKVRAGVYGLNWLFILQELLNHPFLRPTAPAAQDSLVGVTKDQLKKLLIQV